jgi:hypothetical protein
MIKVWPESLEVNCKTPMGSHLFAKDLCTYGEGFTMASSMSDCDFVLIPQFANDYTAPIIFDTEKAELISRAKKPIIFQNDGGGIPAGWKMSDAGKYVWGEWSELIKVFFSIECYSWHRNELPKGINYVPLDFVGYSDFGLKLMSQPPLSTKDEYINRTLATTTVMSVYPPTRDKLWELCWEDNWTHFSFNTNPTYEPCGQNRITWNEMTANFSNSKIGFAPDGATAKTERQLFVPGHTVMMMSNDELMEYPFEWVDGANCLKTEHDMAEGFDKEKTATYGMNSHDIMILNKEKTKEKILSYLEKPNELYEIYCNGYENARKYEIPYYYKHHIGDTIKKYL